MYVDIRIYKNVSIMKIRHFYLYHLSPSICMAKMLPIIGYKGKMYFYDERLHQIRNVENPHDFLDFSEVDFSKMQEVG